jgi:hypothetical protein
MIVSKRPAAEADHEFVRAVHHRASGKDINDETMNDAREPLQIEWYNDSYVRLPILGVK